MLKYAAGELNTSKKSKIGAVLNTVVIPPLRLVVKQRCAVTLSPKQESGIIANRTWRASHSAPHCPPLSRD